MLGMAGAVDPYAARVSLGCLGNKASAGITSKVMKEIHWLHSVGSSLDNHQHSTGLEEASACMGPNEDRSKDRDKAGQWSKDQYLLPDMFDFISVNKHISTRGNLYFPTRDLDIGPGQLASVTHRYAWGHKAWHVAEPRAACFCYPRIRLGTQDLAGPRRDHIFSI